MSTAQRGDGGTADEREATYPRSTRSPRGEARRRELLDSVTEDLLANGLTDFSLRRAARATGTTHKVLLYHFDGAEDLLAQAVDELRTRRIRGGLAAALGQPGSLAARIPAIWAALLGAEADALDQAMGLAMYDPARYGRLSAPALDVYLPPLIELCPSAWTPTRKAEVAGLVLATLRGLILARRTSPESFDHEPALRALIRAVEREETTST